MLIRSQNKMSLVKFENIVINIDNINGKEIILLESDESRRR